MRFLMAFVSALALCPCVEVALAEPTVTKPTVTEQERIEIEEKIAGGVMIVRSPLGDAEETHLRAEAHYHGLSLDSISAEAAQERVALRKRGIVAIETDPAARADEGRALKWKARSIADSEAVSNARNAAGTVTDVQIEGFAEEAGKRLGISTIPNGEAVSNARNTAGTVTDVELESGAKEAEERVALRKRKR